MNGDPSLADLVLEAEEVSLMQEEIAGVPIDALDGDEYVAPRKTPAKQLDYGQAYETGDPIADLWERAIARGETPDLDL